MKLQKLLKQITPLPWLEISSPDGDKWISTNQGDDRITTLDGNTQSIDYAYLVHAANVLPELVAAVRNLQQNWEKNLTQPMARLHEALALAENITVGTSSAAKHIKLQLARTTSETIHGNPGERRVLPANTLVAIVPASNLPSDSAIKYWAHPVLGHPWPADTEDWARDVGVGLEVDDVALVKMPVFRAT